MVAGEVRDTANHSVSAVWAVLQSVPDPEIPVISICDLGIVREVNADADGEVREIVITPTYSGCPAMHAIEEDIRARLAASGLPDVRIRTTLSPAWTTDWMSAAGRAKLAEYGIAPPTHDATTSNVAVVRFVTHRHATPACPHCGSQQTEKLSQFGSTACKALYRCVECREPFDYFKPI
jgi:ring-1,2-phenylacetyl-CoA epoxidase subunit PaaD